MHWTTHMIIFSTPSYCIESRHAIQIDTINFLSKSKICKVFHGHWKQIVVIVFLLFFWGVALWYLHLEAGDTYLVKSNSRSRYFSSRLLSLLEFTRLGCFLPAAKRYGQSCRTVSFLLLLLCLAGRLVKKEGTSAFLDIGTYYWYFVSGIGHFS